jgi:SNF2 family DNA or RNA helicase
LLAEEDTSKEDKQHGDVRVVLFVQYSDLMHNIKQILVQEGIPTVAVEGSTTQEIIRADKAISGFKDRFLSSWSERVLILNSSDVSASGVTLVRANHVIFLHPLFAANQHEFDSKERQAIGRVRRPGQERDIHLYRFYVEHSLDHEILQDRYNISYLVLVKFFSVFFNF